MALTIIAAKANPAAAPSGKCTDRTTRAFVPEMGPLPTDRLKGSGNGGYYCEKVPGRIDVHDKDPGREGAG